MPNKYNIRAKRLTFDNLLRERNWKAIQTNFTTLSLDDARAIILYRNYQTTHRTLLHSLCDVTYYSDSLSEIRSPPPPSELIYMVATACPQALLLHGPGQISDQTPLHIAIAQEASLDTIKSLLNAANDAESINTTQDLLLALDSKGRTPLLAASQAINMYDRDDIIRHLVNQDADGSSLLLSIGSKKNKKKQINSNVPLKYIFFSSRESRHYFDFGLESNDDIIALHDCQDISCKTEREISITLWQQEHYAHHGYEWDK